MANPFFSGRIPQGLLDRIEEYCKETNQGKTEILVHALSKYLDYPVELTTPIKISEESEERFQSLEDRIKILEETVSSFNSLIADLQQNPDLKVIKPEEKNIEVNIDGKKIYNQVIASQLMKLTNITRRQLNFLLEQAIEILKKEGQNNIPNQLLDKPIEVNYKEAVLIEEYPYKIFYAGEDPKGKPVWNLLPNDNACYQLVINGKSD